MKQEQDYQVLKNKLRTLSSNWDKQQGLDPSFIQVIMYGDWRKKKKINRL